MDAVVAGEGGRADACSIEGVVTKKALITGITGQGGVCLAAFMLEKGCEAHGVERRAALFNTDRIDHPCRDPREKDQASILHYWDPGPHPAGP